MIGFQFLNKKDAAIRWPGKQAKNVLQLFESDWLLLFGTKDQYYACKFKAEKKKEKKK